MKNENIQISIIITSYITTKLKTKAKMAVNQIPKHPKHPKNQLRINIPPFKNKSLSSPLEPECQRITEILPWLYLGDYEDSQNMELLSKLKISHIVNATKEPHSPKLNQYTQLYLHLSDNIDENISQVFVTVYNFLEKVRLQNKKVLVHCKCGISRSPSLVIYYLMKTQGTSYSETLDKVKTLRRCVDPNLGFVYSLKLHFGESIME